MTDADEKRLPFIVSYRDRDTGETKVYGRASDQSGADALVASLKVQSVRSTDVKVRDSRVSDFNKTYDQNAARRKQYE